MSATRNFADSIRKAGHLSAEGSSKPVPVVLAHSLSLQECFEGVLGEAWPSYDQTLDHIPVHMS